MTVQPKTCMTRPGDRRERGSTLIFVLAISIVAFGVVATLVMSSQAASRAERARSDSSKAWWSALSGLKLAVRDLNAVPNAQKGPETASFDGTVDGTTIPATTTPADMATRPDGSFAVRTLQQGKDKNGSHYIIEAYGKFGGTVKVLRGVAGPDKFKPFTVGMFSDGITEVAGAGLVDAYDSQLGPYDSAQAIPGVEVLAANGNILLSSTPASFDGDDDHGDDDHGDDDHGDDDHGDDDHCDDDHGDDDGSEGTTPPPAVATGPVFAAALFAPGQDITIKFAGAEATAPVVDPPAADTDDDHGDDDHCDGDDDHCDDDDDHGDDDHGDDDHGDDDHGDEHTALPSAPASTQVASTLGTPVVRFDGEDASSDDDHCDEDHGDDDHGDDDHGDDDHGDDDHGDDDHGDDDHGDDDHGDDDADPATGLWVRGDVTPGETSSVISSGSVQVDGSKAQRAYAMEVPPADLSGEPNGDSRSLVVGAAGSSEVHYLSGTSVVQDLHVGADGKVVVSADTLLYVRGDVSVDKGGVIEIAATAKLELALHGSFTFLGELRNLGVPGHCVISSIADTAATGAKITIETGSFEGAVVGKNLRMSTAPGGTIGFHYDRSLASTSALTSEFFMLNGYVELPFSALK